MNQLNELIAHYGLWMVFINVLLEQLGIPVPAIPTMVVTAAVSVEHQPYSLTAVFAAALVGSSIADIVWFEAGRRFGDRMLKTLCRITFVPDSCVSQTERFYERWGISSLLIAKLIPGFSTVASPLAGAMGVSWAKFAFYNFLGTALWIVTALAFGAFFHDQIDTALAWLESAGMGSMIAIAAALALIATFIWIRRQRICNRVLSGRISVEELAARLEQSLPTVIIDVRTRTARSLDTRSIPGSLTIDEAGFDDALKRVAKHANIIVYCACPNEVSAAQFGAVLVQRGYKNVRPLLGGIDAWEGAGHPVSERNNAARAYL